MLDRSIRTREALVHSIPISEVKDMKSDVLWALKASHSEEKNSFCNISTVEINIFKFSLGIC
jgi:hypothetical protein